MNRSLVLIFALILASGCLPTREQVPFGSGGTNNGVNNGSNNGSNNGVNNGSNNGSNNGVNNGVPDMGNNGVFDTGNNGVVDMGSNNGVVDMGGDAAVIDLGGMDMCVPEANMAFCDRLSAECDSLTDFDNCGVQRTVDCGTCPGAEQCTNNICGMCTPENDTQFCTRNSAECGQLTALDNCRMMRTVNCGGCMGTGVGCNQQNSCQEVDCRDGLDNDGAGGADCDDQACLGLQCTNNPNKVCQADGSCN